VTPFEQNCPSYSETLPLRRANLERRKNRPWDKSGEEMTMKKTNVLVVLVVLFMVAGCSNHTQRVIPRTVASASASVASYSPSAPTSQAVSEAPGPEVAAPVPEITEHAKPAFLSAIAVALNHDKKEFCQDSQSANCDKEFIRAFHFRKVTLSKSGQTGFIVEFTGADFCGSAGCAINVLKQTGEKIERTFENDEVGSLDSFEFATTITNGFYDLTKHGKDGTDYNYTWTGSNYEDVESPLSAGQTQTVAGASEPAQKVCKNCITAKTIGVPFSRNPTTIR
jgi:hypothetical protein